MLIQYPFAIVPFTYVTSFIFTNESSAQNGTIFFHLIFGSMLSNCIFIMRLIETVEDQGDTLDAVFKIVPSYALGSSLLYSSSKKILNETREISAAAIFNEQSQGTKIASIDIETALNNLGTRTNITLESYEMANMGGSLVALAVHSIVFLLILILIEASLCAFKK